MGIKLHLYSSLQTYTGGQSLVEVQGKTIGECLADLVEQFPRLKNELFGEDGKMRSTLFVSINLNSPYPEKLDQVVSSSDEIYLILIIVGG